MITKKWIVIFSLFTLFGLFTLFEFSCASQKKLSSKNPEVVRGNQKKVKVVKVVTEEKAPALTVKESEVSETEARRFLNSMFRNQGFRVVNDFSYQEEDADGTLDGYDPDKKVGFEYISRVEVNLDFMVSEITYLREEKQILVVDFCSMESLESQAKAFFKALK